MMHFTFDLICSECKLSLDPELLKHLEFSQFAPDPPTVAVNLETNTSRVQIRLEREQRNLWQLALHDWE